jgi:cellulose synthase/poly-beta-1,6-N-acetylglucosamine synthase-like glycosyltransferase
MPLDTNPDYAFSISILIAARNESGAIVQCIESILSNKNFDSISPQILIVDDHSEDDTKEKILSFNHPLIKVLSLPENKFAKKAALSFGLEHLTSDYVIQLDADVIVNPDYLYTVCQFIKAHPAEFYAAPVQMHGDKTGISCFQKLDLSSMMSVTLAGISSGFWYMANGANMIFKRTAMNFEINNKQASGDDIFGIQYIRENNGRIQFIKSKKALVSTEVLKDLGALFQQRLRWSTKNKRMKSWKMKFMMLIVLLANLLVLVYIPAYFVLNKTIVSILLFHHLFFMLSIDYMVLKSLSVFFNIESCMQSFLQNKLVHCLYISTVGLLGILGNRYKWKGRTLR